MPVASISAPPEGGQGVALTFDGRGSSDADHDSLTFTWDMGDSSQRAGAIVTHSYANAGSYTVRLIVQDSRGAADTSSVTLTIKAPPSPDYEVIDLGTLGGNSAIPLAFNDRGQVVGSSLTATGQRHAFLWENGTMRDLTPDFGTSEATAISNSGAVGILKLPDEGVGALAFAWNNDLRTYVGSVGYGRIVGVGEGGEVVAATIGEFREWSFIWRDGQSQYLGGLSETNVSLARAMNQSAQVVGRARVREIVGREIQHAFLWAGGAETIRDLGLLSDRPCESPHENVDCGFADAFDINSSGAVVGMSSDASGEDHAVLWADGTVHDLGKGRAIAINDAGDIVGYNGRGVPEIGWEAYPGGEATFWRGGRPTSLGSLGGGVTTIAGINSMGLVAGTSVTATGAHHVFVWNPVTGMADLGKGALVTPAIGAQAIAINSRGDVLGFTYTVNCSFTVSRCQGPTGVVPTRAILWRRK